MLDMLVFGIRVLLLVIIAFLPLELFLILKHYTKGKADLKSIVILIVLWVVYWALLAYFVTKTVVRVGMGL